MDLIHFNAIMQQHFGVEWNDSYGKPNFTAGFRSGSTNFTAANLASLYGLVATAGALDDLDATELGLLNGVTAGTQTASKVVTLDSSKKFNSGFISRLLSSLTAAGTSFGGSGANVEAIMGSGSYDIPANLLAAGDVVRVTVVCTVPTTLSSETFRFRLRTVGVAGTAIYDSTAIDVQDGDYIIANLELTIRTIGATGTAYVTGTVHTKLAGSAATTVVVPTALTGLDTTAALKLIVGTGVWSTQNGNAAAIQQFDVFHN